MTGLDIWALIDGTARFPDVPATPPSSKPHRPFVGWYAGDWPICGAFCNARLEPVRVVRGVVRGWRHVGERAS